jgi:hypothetical protein
VRGLSGDDGEPDPNLEKNNRDLDISARHDLLPLARSRMSRQIELTLDCPPWSLIQSTPERLRPLFPGVTPDAAARVARVAALLGLAFQLEDDLDADRFSPADVHTVQRQIRAHRRELDATLRELAPAEDRYLRRVSHWIAEADHSRAAAWIRVGGRPAVPPGSRPPCTVLDIEHAAERAGAARVIVSALVALTGQEHLHAPLCQAVTDHGVAEQLRRRPDAAAWVQDALARASDTTRRLGATAWLGELRALGAP